jgi:hypothetical protein
VGVGRRPGSPHYLTVARGLPVLVDKGAVGIGVHMPVKHQPDGPLPTDKLAR